MDDTGRDFRELDSSNMDRLNEKLSIFRSLPGFDQMNIIDPSKHCITFSKSASCVF
jgi:hypothetical protein